MGFNFNYALPELNFFLYDDNFFFNINWFMMFEIKNKLTIKTKFSYHFICNNFFEVNHLKNNLCFKNLKKNAQIFLKLFRIFLKINKRCVFN